MKLPSSSAHHTHKHTKLNKTPSTKLERYRKKGLSPRWATQCCSDATSWSERRPPSPTYQNQCAPGCQSPSQLRWRPSHSKLVKLGVTQIISQEGSVLTLEKASSTNQTSRIPGRQLQQIGLCLACMTSILPIAELGAATFSWAANVSIFFKAALRSSSGMFRPR